eukprot:CAMPEP_0195080782 /NCGR_PEP_ID=MMETSP0448-20130528/22413_1 /TAXON_ID=66468 /ORGANISM="Heterocapsa triquestra, Strain CCMP 448" /LENGTH=52 /DNA_ID=CAMNT_0040113761 /DNA_START=371 /DNA_END=527 /DNA_ORIENTATION=-
MLYILRGMPHCTIAMCNDMAECLRKGPEVSKSQGHPHLPGSGAARVTPSPEK